MHNIKYKIALAALTMSMCGVGIISPGVVQAQEMAISESEQGVTKAAGDVEINEVTFPDENFRKYVKANFDLDDNNIITAAEISNIKRIQISNQTPNIDASKIENVKGIEKFTAVTFIAINHTSLTEIDVSAHLELQLLYLSDNLGLQKIDVSQNLKLDTLELVKTGVRGVDVSNNKNLTALDVRQSPIMWLDLGDNQGLNVRVVSEVKMDMTVDLESFDLAEITPEMDFTKITLGPGLKLEGSKVSGYTYDNPVVTYSYVSGSGASGAVDIKVTINLKINKSNSTLEIRDQLDKVWDNTPVKTPTDIVQTGSMEAPVFTWQQKLKTVADTWEQIPGPPTNAGEYVLHANVPASGNFNGTSIRREFTISKAENKFLEPLAISDWVEGKPASVPTAAVSYGDVEFIYSKNKDRGYSFIVPSEAGTWYVCAVVNGTENYRYLESDPLMFQIKQKADSEKPKPEVPKPETPKPGNQGKQETTDKTATSQEKKGPKTGDESKTGLWVLTLLGSGGLVTVLKKRK